MHSVHKDYRLFHLSVFLALQMRAAARSGKHFLGGFLKHQLLICRICVCWGRKHRQPPLTVISLRSDICLRMFIQGVSMLREILCWCYFTFLLFES